MFYAVEYANTVNIYGPFSTEAAASAEARRSFLQDWHADVIPAHERQIRIDDAVKHNVQVREFAARRPVRL